MNNTNISGSKAVLEALIQEETDTIFGYPGGSVIPIYNALYDYKDKLNHILVRHEQCAVHAAQGYARASGKVGVCLVTSGPGATNTVTGLADALLDSTPIVLISGQVASDFLGTDAFQETNFVQITQAVTKWNCQVRHAEDIPAVLAKAFYVAKSGRPGPVVIDITKDAQVGMLDYNYQIIEKIRSYNPYPCPNQTQLKEAAKLINLAKRPMILAGQGVILGEAESELKDFVEKSGIPIASTLLGLSAFDNSHPQYVGMLGMHGNYGPNIKNKDCDLLIAIGMRFDDRVTGDVKTFGKNAKVVHLEVDPSEINKIIYADVPVVANAKDSLPQLTDLIIKRSFDEWIEEFRRCDNIEKDYIIDSAIHPTIGMPKMGEVVNIVADAYERNAIIVTDVGQQQMFAARYSKFAKSRSFISSGGLGTMGFGLPAAIGAKLGAPNRDVCVFVGDGGLQMTIQELGTVLQSHVDIKIIILNNSFLGMVRQWQDLFFDKRYSFTEMINPQFEHIAKGYGIAYECVSERDSLKAAVDRMKNHKGAYILEVKVESEENVFPMVKAGDAVENIILE